MNVLVVDDSIVYRTAIKTALDQLGTISKIQTCSNGQIAVDFLKVEHYDFITLDMEMPVLDGLETIKKIREFNKDVPIIVFASPTANQAVKTMKALEYGANDFVNKVEGVGDIQDSIKMIKDELLPRIDAFKDIFKNLATVSVHQEPAEIRTIKSNLDLISNIELGKVPAHGIFLGSSTGGPDLWRKIFLRMENVNIRTPMFLVQHMPPVFTDHFAKMLDNLVPFHVKEAEHGEMVKPATCYVAPGDYHMTLKRVDTGVQVCLDQNPKVCYVRPAADCLFDTAIEAYGKQIVAIVLTGMGEDGLSSCRKLKASGVPIIIQDEESSVVWGMPGAIAKEELQDAEVPGLKVSDILKGLG